MHKICALAYIFSATCWVGAEDIKLTIASKGDSLSNILYDLFKKSGENFVLDKEIIRKGPEIKLYFNFNEISFTSILESICKNYGLKVDKSESIYYLSFGTFDGKSLLKEKKIETPSFLPEPNSLFDQKVSSTTSLLTQNKKLPKSVLNKNITVRFKRVDLRHLLQTLGKKAGVKIELDENIPLYRLDAFLVKTSLEFALKEITHKTKLAYEFTNHGTLRVFKK